MTDEYSEFINTMLESGLSWEEAQAAWEENLLCQDDISTEPDLSTRED